MTGKLSNQNHKDVTVLAEPEPLAFISHYADVRPRGRRYNLSMVSSIVLHLGILYILVLFPGLLFPNRYWGISLFDEPQPGDEKKYDIITYVPASSRPMYAPYRRPEGSLFSTQDQLAISKPPKLVRDGNRMPYSEGSTKEPMITDVLTRFEPPPEVVEPAAKVETAESGKDEKKLTEGNTQGLDLPASERKPSPTAMIVPPKPKDSKDKAGDPVSKDQESANRATSITREAEARQRVAEDLAKQLKLADAGQKIFENEASALRSEGSGFFDTRGFELSGYSQYVVDKIKDSWLIPSVIRSESGRTTILFYIEKDGQISGLRVVMESGNRRLDSAALNSVLVAGPFPPLPRDFTGEHIGAKLVFSYNEVRTP